MNVEALLPIDRSEISCSRCNLQLPIRIETLKGFVYLLSNSSMPGLLKIGYTDRAVGLRADELSASTGVPSPFEVEAWWACVDPQAIEGQVHARLTEHRMPGREFFAVSLGIAVAAVTGVAGRDPDYIRAPQFVERPRVERPRIVNVNAQREFEAWMDAARKAVR